MIHIFIPFGYGKISRKGSSEGNSGIFTYRHLSCKQVLKFRLRGMSKKDQRARVMLLVAGIKNNVENVLLHHMDGTDALVKEMPEATFPFLCFLPLLFLSHLLSTPKIPITH